MSNSPFLRMDGVVKRFAVRAAVDRVSLDINAGESIVVFGPSGCEKTTLLRLIAGLESPDERDDALALADRVIRMRHGTIEPAPLATGDSR